MGIVSDRKFAVVTGASSGIGFELARQCADHGFDLLICAEDIGIVDAAKRLAVDDVSVEPIQADLSTYEGVEALAASVKGGRAIDALILNAGVGVGGDFLSTDLEAELGMISLNCSSLVHLAKRLLPDMIMRGEGRVLVTASVAATAPGPYFAVYAATKAFALSFAEALRVELADRHITVTALQPGATDTNFFARAGMLDTKVGQGEKDDPAEVAKQGFEAMMAGRESIIAASLKSKLIGLTNEVLPEALKAGVQAKQTEPGSGKKR